MCYFVPMRMVSLVVPYFNNLALADAMLGSVEESSDAELIAEIIVVDDGSREPFAVPSGLSLDRLITVIRRASNGGFAVACNEGVARASSPLVCLLNTDVEVKEGWLRELRTGLLASRSVGIAGNIHRSLREGSIDHAGILFHCQGYPIHYRDEQETVALGRFARFPAVSAACWLCRREDFLSLGGFDTAFRNGFEDVDLCLRAERLGLASIVCNRSELDHHISASESRQEREGKNAEMFLGRWRKTTSVLEREIACDLATIRRSRLLKRARVPFWPEGLRLRLENLGELGRTRFVVGRQRL